MTVAQLYIYPVKSCRGISILSGNVVERGFQHDRRFMIVDEDNVFLTQRIHPRMALIHTAIESGSLVLSVNNAFSISVPLSPKTQSLFPVTIWHNTVPATLVSCEADRLLNEFLGIRCRLVYMPDESRRPVPPEFQHSGEVVSFADGFPFLLISQESLNDLNNRLSNPLSMSRFRPNIVVKGVQPYAEDEWKTIEIGAVRFRSAKLCDRCSITTVDQETGNRSEEPLRTLATFRKRGGKVMFGQNLIHENMGRINIGDEITILE